MKKTLLLFFVFILISTYVGAEDEEEISVIVTDQDGFAFVGSMTNIESINLVVSYPGDSFITIELTPEEIMSEDPISIEIEHYGTYEIFAIAKIVIDKWVPYSYTPPYSIGDVDYDDKGPYRITDIRDLGTGGYEIVKTYTYHSVGYAITNVFDDDKDDVDIARIAIETRQSELEKVGVFLANKIQIEENRGVTPYFELSWGVVGEALEGRLPQWLSDIYLDEITSIVIIRPASLITNPEKSLDDMFSQEGQLELMGDVSSGYIVGFFFGGSGVLTRGVLGFVLWEGSKYGFDKFYYEPNRCLHAETDDYYVIYNDDLSNAFFENEGYECDFIDQIDLTYRFRCALSSINLGAPIYKIKYVSYPFEDGTHKYENGEVCELITDEVWDNDVIRVEPTYYGGEVESEHYTWLYPTACFFSENIEKYRLTKPLITSVQHPEYTYAGETVTITATVRDDSGIPR